MSDQIIKFRFAKTPQLRHEFRCARGNQIFPSIKIDVFEAILVDDVYQFRGHSASGSVARANFYQAINEGFVVLEQG